MEFILATENSNKVKEFNSILVPMGIEVVALKDTGLGLSLPEETGTTFEENAEIKAMSVYNASGQPSIADDSGLVVESLGGAPGVYSSRYAGEGASDKQKVEKLLFEMRNFTGLQRKAKFVCVICCVLPGGDKIFARGECLGSIASEVRGTSGFGYDPVFVVDNNKTFAEMQSWEKDKISHRGLAIKNLCSLLKDKFKFSL